MVGIVDIITLTGIAILVILMIFAAMRAVQNRGTKAFMTNIYYLLIWPTFLVAAVLAVAKGGVTDLSLHIAMHRTADVFVALLFLWASFFATHTLYGSLFKNPRGRLINLLTIIIIAFLTVSFLVLEIASTQITGGYYEVTYASPTNYVIMALFYPLIIPLGMVFTKLMAEVPEKKLKWALYLVGFAFIVIASSFDMPGILAELLWLWRSIFVTGIILNLVAFVVLK